MSIYYDVNHRENVVLALGFFDGVHLAHQKLIKKAVKIAKENNIQSALITFLDSPSSIISNSPALYITPLKEKISIINGLGIDDIYILDFKKYQNIEAKTYIKETLIRNFSPKFVVTGFNHRFGINGKGGAQLLSSYGSKFQYIEINPVKSENTLVSSTNIKNAVQKGEIEFANKMLNRNFSISGTVIRGQGIAGSLGYKTANIIWDKTIVKPKYGVYFGFAEFERKKYPSIINFGIRPSIDKNLTETLEVHLKNFEGNLYGKTIKVEFVSHLRDEIKFSSIGELKKQIDKDYNSLFNA